MGQSDPDPRKIALNLHGNLPIEILYQYALCCIVRETQLRDNYSISKKGLCISIRDYV